jgi:threonine dehydrogenase-like Zn-dependent dehydrogenase
MKAVVFHGVGDIRLDDVPEPEIQEPFDRRPGWIKVELLPKAS